MSKYTTEVRYICEAESGFDFSDPMIEHNIDDIIDAARPKIFIYPYPFFDEGVRPEFERNILFHFYTDEIGQETVGLWKMRLGAKLRDIMPYFNDLFRAYARDFDIFADVDYQTDHQGSESGQKDTEGSTRSEGNYTGSGSRQGETTDTESGSARGTSAKTGTSQSDRDLTERTTSENDSTGTSTNDGRTTGTSHNTGSTSKNVTNSYNETNVHRDAYSDTPQTSILGVEGDGSGDPEHNVSDNYYLTNYRKITDVKNGGNTGSETGSSTADGTTGGTSHDEGATTGHSEGVGTHTAQEGITGSTGENGETTETTESTARGTASEITSDQHTTADVGSSTGRESFANNDAYVNRVHGKQGSASYSAMLMEYIQSRINIMEMIYEKLDPLFMGIY